MDEWHALAGSFRDFNYCQTGPYVDLAARSLGARAERLAILEDDRVIGACGIRVRSYRPLPSGIAYVRWGPVCKTEAGFNSATFRKCVMALVSHYVRDRRMTLRLVSLPRPAADSTIQAKVLDELGFGPISGADANRTIVKSLAGDDGELERSFDKKWKYELVRARRSPVPIDHGTDDARFEAFATLYDELRQRKSFSVNQDLPFFRAVQKRLTGRERLVVHLAWTDGKPIAGHVGSFAGETAVYLFGASNEAGRELRAAYLLQWEVMRYAREIGANWYDLGGIDAIANPDVYRFKKRMNGEEVEGATSEYSGGVAVRAMNSVANLAYGFVRRLR